MYLKYLKLSYLFAFLGILVSPISAQEYNINQFLKNQLNNDQMGLNFSDDILNKLPGVLDKNIDYKLPNAKAAKTQNLQSLKKNQQAAEQLSTDAANQLNISNIQRYYQLLTPEILPIFGQKSFATVEKDDVLFFNTVGREYKLAPGDILNITVRGLKPIDAIEQVSQVGNIILPDLHPVHVEGLDLKQVEDKIFNLVKFDDSSAFVNISLKAARLVPVQITGSARHPKTIAIPAYTPLSRILSKFGGVREDGSFRNITLTDSSGVNQKIDLYGLLRGEDIFDDPLLTNSTRIHVNDIGSTVAVTGFVGRPGIFELPHQITEIKAEKLLELANAKMLPPGATIEILKFDNKGVVQKQKIQSSKNLTIYAGEVLNIELPQTTHTNRILVQGAVHKAYEVTSKNDKSLAEILKYGATLKDNALLNFAIIKPKPTTKNTLRTVDLHHAFAHPHKVMVSPGESIIILNSMLQNLILDQTQQIHSIQNTGINPLELEQNELRELNQQKLIKEVLEFIEVEKLLRVTQKIYVDDVVVALVPNIPKNASLTTVKELINLPSDLNLDFAFSVENFGKTNKKLIPFSPKDVFNNNKTNILFSSQNTLSNVKLFSNKYLKLLFEENINNPPNDRQNFIITDQFNQISNKNVKKFKQAESDEKAYFLSKDEVKEIRPVLMYVNDQLKYVISNNTPIEKSVAFRSLTTNASIYPFLVRAERFNASDKFAVPTTHYSSFAELMTGGGALSKVEFFTIKFIRNLLNNEEINLTDILDEQKKGEVEMNPFSRDQLTKNAWDINQIATDQLALNQIGRAQIQNSDRVDANQNRKPLKKIFRHLTAVKRNSKLFSGALENPGFYPVVGEINLEDVISIAGGLLPGADLENITIREYGNNKGATDIIGTKYIDITSIHPKRVLLDGYFNVFIPFLVNNADVGMIEVEGEVSHPGKYSFSRTETLEEILARAGGFTETAYPLGASFFRESLKDEQKVSNQNLAREIERSILFLSQSQVGGAGDQIKAVITYANQLKNLPTSGKQTLNIEGSSKKMLLQDGDKLFIPKRPSHVTISGSVQNPVTAVYHPEKSLETYISDAGGLKRIADRKNIFVLLPNGQNITLLTLQKDGAVIPAGSVIIVPPKTDKLTALGLTDIWSRVLGNIATSILAINAATQ